MLKSAGLNRPKNTAQQTRDFVTGHAFNHLIGVELLRIHRDGVTLRCQVRKELLNSAGVLHGGVAASLADAAVGSALHHHYPERRPFTTVELKINYFRPVSEGCLVARSRLLRVGSSISVGQVDLTDGQRRDVGVAICTYMFLGHR